MHLGVLATFRDGQIEIEDGVDVEGCTRMTVVEEVDGHHEVRGAKDEMMDQVYEYQMLGGTRLLERIVLGKMEAGEVLAHEAGMHPLHECLGGQARTGTEPSELMFMSGKKNKSGLTETGIWELRKED